MRQIRNPIPKLGTRLFQQYRSKQIFSDTGAFFYGEAGLLALIEKRQLNQETLSLTVAALPTERGWLMDDPTKNWRLVHCPVLALGGAIDHQVPPEATSLALSRL